jgi:hypothetical protein
MQIIVQSPHVCATYIQVKSLQAAKRERNHMTRFYQPGYNLNDLLRSCSGAEYTRPARVVSRAVEFLVLCESSFGDYRHIYRRLGARSSGSNRSGHADSFMTGAGNNDLNRLFRSLLPPNSFGFPPAAGGERTQPSWDRSRGRPAVSAGRTFCRIQHSSSAVGRRGLTSKACRSR